MCRQVPCGHKLVRPQPRSKCPRQFWHQGSTPCLTCERSHRVRLRIPALAQQGSLTAARPLGFQVPVCSWYGLTSLGSCHGINGGTLGCVGEEKGCECVYVPDADAGGGCRWGAMPAPNTLSSTRLLLNAIHTFFILSLIQLSARMY